MPLPYDQETLYTQDATAKPGRLPKNNTVPAQTTAKNGKKNGSAKDVAAGGILAAVTKSASKISSKPVAAPRVPSPEMKPTTSNGDPITSPLLDALSSAALGPTQNTTEWARNVPAYSSSPGNLINLGESPPALPSSYEDRLTNFGWNIREQRGIPNGHPASASPPTRRRPLSFQVDGNYPVITEDMYSQASSNRRSSMFSQYPRYGSHPPLPHQPQAHFYGAPDAQILSPPPPGLIPGERGYHCGFDSLSFSHDATKTADNVIVAGYEGGINIYSASRRGLQKVAMLEGLRCGVYSAKILPWDIRGASTYPLIAVVVHGPVWTSDHTTDFGASPSEPVSMTSAESMRGSPVPQNLGMHEDGIVESYQTTVEIYSLDTKSHITTLLSLPPTRLPIPTTSPMFRAPPPVGSLTLQADKGNLIVTSGTSGETWIFRHEPSKLSAAGAFKCIGKVWTTVQYGVTVEEPASNPSLNRDWQSPDPTSARKQYKASILSLSGRWLAYCPAAPSSQVSLRATVPGAVVAGRIPGLNSHAPPQLPVTNCAVETPGGESMIKQLAQAATQEMIKGVSYLGKQGAQAWNNYWSKPSANVSAGAAYGPITLNHQFPPTHGVTSQPPTANRDPGLISIIDLEILARHPTGSTPHPLVTFRVPLGCSFLSFAPSGLALFTASSKGDTQFVWDLMRMQYAKSSFLKGPIPGSTTQGTHVRQIAQFSRMTIARIVDVVWNSPHGERAAMVTEPGTVHILDLPASAFTWPPPRRKVVQTKPDDAEPSIPLSAASVASNAVSSLWTAARPLVSRPRRSSAGISAITVASVTSSAGHGTQVLAGGISRSVGAATGRMNEMRKAGTTKLHLPRSATVPSRSCVRIIDGKRNDSVIVLGGGIVGFYTIKSRNADRPADKQKASRGAKYFELRIPSLPDLQLPPEVMRDLSHAADLDLTDRDMEVAHSKLGNSPKPPAQSHGTESSIPQAEIESNAPYQPFHTDRRVALFVYSQVEANTFPSVSVLLSPPEPKGKSGPSSATSSTTPWSFGFPIPTTKLDVGPSRSSEDDLDAVPSDHRALPSSAIERIMRVTDSTLDTEQIVVTTRRRKGVGNAGGGGAEGGVGEEGFFEDDCEVLDFASQRV